MTLPEFVNLMQKSKEARGKAQEPELPVWEREFGLREDNERNLAGKKVFKRNSLTGLFDDQEMVDELLDSMDDPIGKFAVHVGNQTAMLTIPVIFQPTLDPTMCHDASGPSR